MVVRSGTRHRSNRTARITLATLTISALAVPAVLVAAGSASASGAGGTLSLFAGTGTAGAPTAGPATESKLSDPFAVAADSAGNIYIADEGNSQVEKVTPGGTLSIIAGTGTEGTPTPGPATASHLGNPRAVAVDGSGNVYITDYRNSRVDKVTSDGTLSILAGDGTGGAPTPGPATSSHLTSPGGIGVDGSGNVYIGDTNSQRVEKVTPDGTLSIIVGNGNSGAPTPGPATASSLSYPYGVAVDGSGNVYVADAGNNRVEKVDPDGTLSIFAGTGTAGPPTAGPAASSRLNSPLGVAVDGAGSVYIGDQGNSRVEKVDPSGTLSIVAGRVSPRWEG
jgi:sugar lactone lactonase YvrE